MSGVLKDIWRHPLKSHGRENLQSVKLSVGQSLPWDRHWAVAHDSAKKDIDSNKEHLNSMKDKTAIEWRNYATQCMIEILDHKTKS